MLCVLIFLGTGGGSVEVYEKGGGGLGGGVGGASSTCLFRVFTDENILLTFTGGVFFLLGEAVFSRLILASPLFFSSLVFKEF